MISVLLTALGVLVGMLLCLEAGRRAGAWLRTREGDRVETAAATIDGAIFALFGLLIAFTFSGAASRFDHRRYASAKDERPNWFHNALFAVVIAACIFIILDLEHPRIGFIRLDEADRVMQELLAGMK